MSFRGYVKGNKIKRFSNRLMVYTSNGRFFLASREDEEKIRSKTWQISSRKLRPKNCYVKCTKWHGSDTRETILLHREIVGAKKGDIVDHINGNTLDNRRENLRIVTHQQNCYNREALKKGINKRIWPSGRVAFRARIRKDNRLHHLGYFDTIEEAIKAREDAKSAYFGEFARKAD